MERDWRLPHVPRGRDIDLANPPGWVGRSLPDGGARRRADEPSPSQGGSGGDSSTSATSPCARARTPLPRCPRPRRRAPGRPRGAQAALARGLSAGRPDGTVIGGGRRAATQPSPRPRQGLSALARSPRSPAMAQDLAKGLGRVRGRGVAMRAGVDHDPKMQALARGRLTGSTRTRRGRTPPREVPPSPQPAEATRSLVDAVSRRPYSLGGPAEECATNHGGGRRMPSWVGTHGG
jgi:hypothetical protein